LNQRGGLATMREARGGMSSPVRTHCCSILVGELILG